MSNKCTRIDFPLSEKVFFTSDTHFSHKKIIDFCNRPFSSIDEMNEKLIENWNSVVSKDSIVFHLGDFAFSSNWSQFVSRLNGYKFLIFGNHDLRDWKNTFENLFDGVDREYNITIDNQKIVLSHYPLLCWQGCNKQTNPTWNLHGHIHSGPNISGDDPDNRRYKLYKLPNQYDCGVDNNDFKPISFLEIRKKLSNI